MILRDVRMGLYALTNFVLSAWATQQIILKTIVVHQSGRKRFANCLLQLRRFANDLQKGARMFAISSVFKQFRKIKIWICKSFSKHETYINPFATHFRVDDHSTHDLGLFGQLRVVEQSCGQPFSKLSRWTPLSYGIPHIASYCIFLYDIPPPKASSKYRKDIRLGTCVDI